MIIFQSIGGENDEDSNVNCEENSVQDTTLTDNVLQEPRLNPGF